MLIEDYHTVHYSINGRDWKTFTEELNYVEISLAYDAWLLYGRNINYFYVTKNLETFKKITYTNVDTNLSASSDYSVSLLGYINNTYLLLISNNIYSNIYSTKDFITFTNLGISISDTFVGIYKNNIILARLSDNNSKSYNKLIFKDFNTLQETTVIHLTSYALANYKITPKFAESNGVLVCWIAEQILYSTDNGATWNAGTPKNIYNNSDSSEVFLFCDNGKFIISTDRNTYVSVDGINWTYLSKSYVTKCIKDTNSNNFYLWDTKYNNASSTLYSINNALDISSYTTINMDNYPNFGSVYDIIKTSNNKYVALTSKGLLYDCVLFTKSPNNYQLCKDYDALIALPNNLDVVKKYNWTNRILRKDNNKYIEGSIGSKKYEYIFYHAWSQRWFAFGTSDTASKGVAYSTDSGKTWTHITTSDWLKPLTSINSVIIASGNTSGIFISKDRGESWEQITDTPLSAPEKDTSFTKHINKLFALSNYGNNILSTTDGITWQTTQLPYSISANSICSNNSKIIVAGAYGILYSNNGTTWNKTNIYDDTFTHYYNFNYVTYFQNKWFAVTDGYKPSSIQDNTIYGLYTSNDGITWTKVNLRYDSIFFQVLTNSEHALFCNGYMLNGNNQIIKSAFFTSYDGINWTEHNNNEIGLIDVTSSNYYIRSLRKSNDLTIWLTSSGQTLYLKDTKLYTEVT